MVSNLLNFILVPEKLKQTCMAHRIYPLMGMIMMAIMGDLSAQNWQMVWSDEFDGDSLDQSKWSYMTGTGSEYGLTDWGNNELQYYLEDNVAVRDGFMTITAKVQSKGGKSYTSGRIRTIDKGDWKYGKFEFRAKMPKGKGLWAAIWMLPTDLDYGGWASSGEIDIMEFLGDQTTTVHGTLHFGGTWPNNRSNGASYETPSWPFSSEFHDFMLIWEEGRMRWYVDGNLYQDQGAGDWYSSAAAFPAPFDKRFHLLINLAVGGNWPGTPDGSTSFPQDFVVDYVRVYQDLPVGVEQGLSGGDAGGGLGQNVPNPFHSTTLIPLSLREPGHVKLEVYDLMGRRVATAVDREYGSGTYQVEFDGSGLTPGLYTYRITAGELRQARQMVIWNQ